MSLPVYSTGTVSVAAGGTVVTGVGGMWSGTNVKQGDFISIAGSTAVLITEVTDTTHLKIAPWPGAAQSGAVYLIYQNYVGRVVGVAAAEDVSVMLEKLHTDGLPFILGASETVPDPSYGDEGQLAFKPSTGEWWVKSGGAWVPSYGLTALGYGGSSATSLLIGLGSKVFTTQANLAYNGARVRAASAANLNNFMEGVASYVGTTLTMNCDLIGGSGTFADWLLSIAGQKGVAGTTGAIGPAGPAGGTFPDAPSDGVLYGRRNAAWAAASAALYLNVRDYGATGNGTTDDTAAINSALAAAGGRTVFFPKGYYIVSSVLTPAAGTRLLGENYQNTYLKTNQANGSIIDCVNGYITIESLGFNATVAQTGGIYVNARGSGCNLKNLFFVGGFVSIRVDNTAVLLSDITISSVASSGSAVGIDVWSGLANTWHNIQADCRNGYACFVLHNCGDVTATNCRFMSGSFAGAIAPASGQVVLFAKFIGCDFDQAGVYALYIAPAAGGIVQLVELTNIEVYGASIGVEIAGAGTVDCVVIDQMISIGCANFGVDVSAAGGATIRNVSVLNSLIAAQNSVNSSTAINYSGVNGGRISGNRIGATTQYFGNNSGVVVTGNSTDIIIDGNDLRSNTTSLTLGGSCDRISLANNDLTGAAVTWTTTGIDISWISNIGFSGWKTFTPNVVSGTGAITALGAVTGGYLLSGKTVFWNVSIGVTTVGSAGTDLRVSNMPFNAVRNTPGFGRNNSTGWMLQGYIAGTSSYLIIGKFDNGFPVADGSNIFLAGLYERT